MKLISNRPSSSDRKCLLQILKTIDNIQSTINRKLEKNHSKQSNTPQNSSPFKHTHLQRGKSSQNSKSATKGLKNSEIRVKTQANPEKSSKKSKQNCSQLSRNQKKFNQSTFFQTPRKKETLILNDNNLSIFNLVFDSPFDNCVFQKSERTKKLSQTPKKLLLREKDNNRDCQERKKTGKSNNWTSKRQESKENDKESSKKYKVKGSEVLSGYQVQRYYANQQYKLYLQQVASRLQQEFQKCLIEKRHAPQNQQALLRQKMEKLSFKINKIRLKQASIAV